MTSRLARARRIVVKIGSALLVDAKTGAIKASWLASLIGDLADARVGGADVIVVSSGAIALGRRSLGLPKGKLKLEQSQAAAEFEGRSITVIEQFDPLDVHGDEFVDPKIKIAPRRMVDAS